jgi:hypothetical protein
MHMAASGFELRTLTFIDSLQPQLAQYIAKDNRVYDPKEYDAALMIEIAPAMEIHTMIDIALKATAVRLTSVVTERQFGLMLAHHGDQGEVKAAGKAILRETALDESDRAVVEILTMKTSAALNRTTPSCSPARPAATWWWPANRCSSWRPPRPPT